MRADLLVMCVRVFALCFACAILLCVLRARFCFALCVRVFACDVRTRFFLCCACADLLVMCERDFGNPIYHRYSFIIIHYVSQDLCIIVS